MIPIPSGMGIGVTQRSETDVSLAQFLEVKMKAAMRARLLQRDVP
jgi:hypothetical protein